MQIIIENIYCGKSQNIKKGDKIYKSSYKKQPVSKSQTIAVGYGGLADDTQSDYENHGGTDKAICVYAGVYYEFFKTKYDIQLTECAFGENFTIASADDSDICIGDRFECGEVVLEVSQPRQPCWKISSVVGIKNLTSLLVTEYKTGFYMRVIKTGNITTDDCLSLISRDYPDMTIEYINRCSYDAKNHQTDIKKILQCDKLSASYKNSISKRYKQKEQGIEDWQKDQRTT